MTIDCALKCGMPLNPHDIGVWKEVKGFVGGPKKDAMTLREDTGQYAHNACVQKARRGLAPDQEALLPDEGDELIVDLLDGSKIHYPQPMGSAAYVTPFQEDSDDVAELEEMLDEQGR